LGPPRAGLFNLEGNREGRGAVYDSEARYAGNGEFDSDPRLQPPIAHCHVIPAMRAVLFGPLALSRASRGRTGGWGRGVIATAHGELPWLAAGGCRAGSPAWRNG